MIFRELNKKLYKIDLPLGVSEEDFFEKQQGGLIAFIMVKPNNLPQVPENEKRKFSKLFYKFDDNNNIVIDYERTIERWMQDKYKQIEKYIYQYYPQVKQNSDLADKLYYENILKASNVQNIEADIVTRVQDFYSGKTLDEVLADVPEEHKEAYEQLIKVGIRVAWVQHCKKELKSAIAENREPEFQDYPL